MKALLWNLTYKNGEDNYMKMVFIKKIVGYSKLKLWKCFWGHGQGEHEFVYYVNYINW